MLADEGTKWRPRRFGYTRWGCTLNFTFPIVKLVDYRKQWAALEASRNPFATVVMAHLKTQETRRDDAERGRWKFALMRRLYEQSYSRQDIVNLFHFINWIMQLPTALEDDFWKQLKTYEEAQRMPYVSRFEQQAVQRGFDAGIDRGLKQGTLNTVLRLLTRRCGPLDAATTERVCALTIPQLDALADALLDFSSLADLHAWLKHPSSPGDVPGFVQE